MVLLLALFGIAVGCSLVFLPFPTNCAVPYTAVLGILTFIAPWTVILALLGMTPWRILWQAGGIAPIELLYSLSFLWLLGISILRQFFRKPVASQPVWVTSLSPAISAMIGVGLWGALIGILRGHSFAHWTSDLNFILFFGLYFVITVNLDESRDLLKVLWPNVWITAVVVIWGIVKRFSEGTLYRGITPGFPRGMAFSSTCFVFIVCLFLFSPSGTLKRKGLVVLSLFFGLHQLLSFVRVAWISQIGTAGFLLRVLPFSEKRRYLRWIGSLSVAAALVFSFSWILPTENLFIKMPIYAMERFASIFTDTTGTGATMQTRYSEWRSALATYREHPLAGNGLGTEIRYIRYDYEGRPLTTERYIHSSYVYYLLNTGPLGLLVFCWFCFRAVQYGMRVYRSLPESELKGLALGMTASFVYQIFSSIAGNELNNPSRTIWTGFFLGALAVIERQTKRSQEAS